MIKPIKKVPPLSYWLKSLQTDILSRSGIHFETTCCVCELTYIGNLRCNVCNNCCHEKPSCSKVVNMESEPITILCLLCAMSKRVKHDECKDNLSRQAEKMINASVKRFKQADIGDNVLVAIPDVDMGRGDVRNIKGIVTVWKVTVVILLAQNMVPSSKCIPGINLFLQVLLLQH